MARRSTRRRRRYRRLRWKTTTSSERSSSAYPRSRPTSCAPPSSPSAGEVSPPTPSSSTASASTTGSLPSSASSSATRTTTTEYLSDPPWTRPTASLPDASPWEPTAVGAGAWSTAATDAYSSRTGSSVRPSCGIPLLMTTASLLFRRSSTTHRLSSATGRCSVPPASRATCTAAATGALSNLSWWPPTSPRIKLSPSQVSTPRSETGIWGDLLSTAIPETGCISRHTFPSILVGSTLHWPFSWSRKTAQFDLVTQRLAVAEIERPPGAHYSVQIIHSEDGGVAFATLSRPRDKPCFQMWEKKANCYGVPRWVLLKSVELQSFLGSGFKISTESSSIVRYAEDAHAIFLRVHSIVYMVQLETMQSKELFFERDPFCTYHPFSSFSTEGL